MAIDPIETPFFKAAMASGSRGWKMPPVDLTPSFEDVLKRIVQWMIDNPDACAAQEAKIETVHTDFGDIRIVPNRFVDHDSLVASINDKPIAAIKFYAPR